jgi:preprotein translocase subunit SecG
MENFLFPLVLTAHILVGLSIIGLVLLQHGKGADMGAAFGGGASGSLFGASGSANFMSRTTGVLAAIFFSTSLTLSYMATNRPKPASSVIDTVKTQTAPASSVAPAKPEAPLANDSKAKDIPK